MTHAKPAFSPLPSRITRIALPLALVLLAPLLTEGCSTASYPSLARREAETFRDAAPASRPQATAPVAPQRYAELLAEAQSCEARFAAQRARVEAALTAAQGAKAGDAAWGAANMQLVELERARADLGSALAALDRLYADDRLSRNSDEDEALTKARATVSALAEAEDAVLGSLRARLP